MFNFVACHEMASWLYMIKRDHEKLTPFVSWRFKTANAIFRGKGVNI